MAKSGKDRRRGRRWTAWALAAVLGAVVPVAGAQEVITLVADAWPPFNCAADDSNEGYMIDVARAVFEPLGCRVEYRIVPWRRALAGTHSGLYDGAVAPSRIEGPELWFPARELSRNRVSFFVDVDSDWRFSGPASLEQVSLGVVSGYDYVDWLNDYIAGYAKRADRVQALAGDYPLVQNLRKLTSGRIDVLAGNADSIRYVASRLGLLHRIRYAGCDAEESWCYIAFSPATGQGERYAEILSRGIDDLRQSGRLAAILARYGLTDWAGEGGAP